MKFRLIIKIRSACLHYRGTVDFEAASYYFAGVFVNQAVCGCIKDQRLHDADQIQTNLRRLKTSSSTDH